MITAKEARELCYFNAKVVTPFTARWVNPIWRNGKLVDDVRERAFSEGETVYCNEWRPEGMNVKGECDKYPMFVGFEHFDCLELA